MPSKKWLTGIVFFIGIFVAGFLTSVFRIFAPYSESTDTPQMKINRHPLDISGCEGQYLLVARFMDSNGATLRYSFIVTDGEEEEAIQYAVEKSEKAFDLIAIVRANYFAEAVQENTKLIESYEQKKDKKDSE